MYDGTALHYVGHTGTGFDEQELRRVAGLVRRLEIATCPFVVRPKPNERPHWVRPTLVAEAKFTEWTSEGKLRHPTYLGLRDDIDATTIHRERDCLHNDIRTAFNELMSIPRFRRVTIGRGFEAVRSEF